MNDIVMCFRNEHGQTIEMTMNNLKDAYDEYRFLTKRDYIFENYPESEACVDRIAARAIELEDSYHYREDDAIEQAFDEIM